MLETKESKKPYKNAYSGPISHKTPAISPAGIAASPMNVSKVPNAVPRISASDKSETSDFCEASEKARNIP